MNNDKQLTPEEVLRKLCVGSGIWNIRTHMPTTYEKIIKSIEEYAAQQTAAKDEEIRQLKEWKKEQIKTFAPLLDYGQSPESGIQIGRSIVEASIAALKSQKVKDERLKELEVQCLDAERDYRKSFKDGLQKGARIAELEKELKEKRERNSELHRELTGIRSSVRVVGRLREDIKVLNDEANIKNQQLRADLDQAFDLLECNWEDHAAWKTAVKALLSSRENNKAR